MKAHVISFWLICNITMWHYWQYVLILDSKVEGRECGKIIVGANLMFLNIIWKISTCHSQCNSQFCNRTNNKVSACLQFMLLKLSLATMHFQQIGHIKYTIVQKLSNWQFWKQISWYNMWPLAHIPSLSFLF